MRKLLRINTIFRKDLRDAIRDARVLIALLLPLGFGVFYNFTFDDEEPTPEAKVAYFSPDPTTLPNELAAVVGDTVDVQFFAAGSRDQVEQELGNGNADLGIVLPAGFDDALANGEQPRVEVLQPEETSFGGDFVTAAIEPALREMAGQAPPAELDVSVAANADESESALDKVGLRSWSILFSIVLMVSMIAMLAIPVILAEETEKRTLEALVLVATHVEVIAAKALLGIFYVLIMVPLLLAITKFHLAQRPLFIAAVALMSVSLIGLGLLMAGFFKSANQLNTWSGLMLTPVIAPAFIITLPAPGLLKTAAELFPTGAGMRLLMNSAVTERIYGNMPLSFAVIVVWGIAAYLLLLWQLSRQSA